ncbi:DUF6223 family protein [Niabella sp. CC-SYL272]|uniref:DUF6223 family protein n=1 Tax=Niabella agricola TaxID=2891571 RepID=UPI001F301D58|nr:DUF6223 family protein [Niabella agricola]MCF3108142.1 DUF6223 family protein [Niabella agricola]
MKVILRVIPACLFMVFIVGSTVKVFSQTNQPEDKMNLTNDSSKTAHKAANYVKGLTAPRAIALAEGLLGLMSIISGWRAKKRPTKKSAKTAILFGLLAIIFGIVHLAITSGAVFGSGSGKAGSIFALLLGLIGVMLGGRILRLLQNERL